MLMPDVWVVHEASSLGRWAMSEPMTLKIHVAQDGLRQSPVARWARTPIRMVRAPCPSPSRRPRPHASRGLRLEVARGASARWRGLADGLNNALGQEAAVDAIR
eukprot:CAMPEP_0206041390 /NCGR_PEP_ID=MMETSP1466-20131121/5945_1 /ASSEMBLY_ACC=CAM_ASM_001126 /TAXON_ID=44452 /ORGANISM="Pavlova gyrans, Strain CCMP608" /LENGTH=103 /DNA_ID=CAMNT_0053416087 /DNA_START=30 /DNA_END=341 /DNA_ORIENTATION=-